MKIGSLLIFAATISLVTATSHEELWKKFKNDHSRTYRSLREDKIRFEIFKSTLETVRKHNLKYENGDETWFMGINQFSDLTDEEFEVQFLSYKSIRLESLGVMSFNVTVPDSIDWRDQEAVLSVKDQGTCGSCWAFSAVGAIEAQNAIKHGVKIDLSPQELVDCSKSYGNDGCFQGWMDDAFAYVKDHGLCTLVDYPYKALPESCKNQSNSGKIQLIGYKDVEHNEEQLKQAVASVGPISVGINANTVKNYKGGIFNNFFCGYHLNHGVLAVGYGTEDKHDFWIVKNSWGANWGEHGYIRMTRNRFNQCGIASLPSYPELA